MAGRKKRTIIEESLPDTPLEGTAEPSEFDVSMEAVEDADTLKSVLSQFGETNLVLKILRKSPTGPEFCYQTDSLDEQFIQQNFGGGDYTVRIFINGIFKHAINIKIANRLINPNNPVVSSPTDRHSEFLEKALLALLGRETPVPTQQATPVGELAQAMTQLHQLNGGGSDRSEKMIETLIKGFELGKDLSAAGTGDWKSELIGAVKHVLPEIMGAYSGMKQGIPPGTNPVPAVNDPNVMLRSGIAYLKKKAISGVDPMLFVDFVAANADEEQYQGLIHAVLTKDYSDFAAIDPEIGTAPFIEWFKPLYDGIRSAFSPVDSMANDSAGKSGDTANPGNNGTVGKKGAK